MGTVRSLDSQKVRQPVLCIRVRGKPCENAGARARSSEIPEGRDGLGSAFQSVVVTILFDA